MEYFNKKKGEYVYYLNVYDREYRIVFDGKDLSIWFSNLGFPLYESYTKHREVNPLTAFYGNANSCSLSNAARISNIISILKNEIKRLLRNLLEYRKGAIESGDEVPEELNFLLEAAGLNYRAGKNVFQAMLAPNKIVRIKYKFM